MPKLKKGAEKIQEEIEKSKRGRKGRSLTQYRLLRLSLQAGHLQANNPESSMIALQPPSLQDYKFARNGD
jgi:hypothetical protein